MALAFPPADARYVAFIDEAGDTGLTRVRPLHPEGSSEWLVLSAIVVRIERELELPSWVRRIRTQVGATQGPALHYRSLSDDRKASVCDLVAALPQRSFVLLSNKKNMQGHRNARAEAARASAQEYYYNFCVRLLLERVTAFAERMSQREHGVPKHLSLVFSERGGLRYSQTIAYLSLLQEQARSGTTFLSKREVRWAVLHPALMTSVPHRRSAGAQLADVIASAFFQATNTSGPGIWNPTFAARLKPRMWRQRAFENCGVSLQPTPYSKAQLNENQKSIFRTYGFSI